MPNNIEMLQRVALGLGELNDEVVFVGGSVAELYANDPAASDIRPTLDVDCVVELSTRTDYYQFEERLRKRQFRNDTTPGAPICRWIFEDIIVDIMPADSDILGFSNRWYKAGIAAKQEHTLPNGDVIYIFPVEYYLATKFEALNSRGGKDLRFSHDFEDIVYVLDNREGIVSTIFNSRDRSLLAYIGEQCRSLLSCNNIREAVDCALPYGSGNRDVVILEMLKQLSQVG